MVLLRVLVLATIVGNTCSFMERKLAAQMIYEATCNNLTAEPFFEDDLVVGTIWRIYYAWNVIMGEGCTDMKFKKASYELKERFKKMMHQHLESQPNWSNATLLMTMNVSREMLLIPDTAYLREVSVGRFLGVPNIHKGGYVAPRLGEVSLFRMAMKLFNDGRYLIVSDCLNGITSFLVRRDQKHTKGEITAFVKRYSFGEDGNPACKYKLKKKRDRLH